jgi:hypothetical protein
LPSTVFYGDVIMREEQPLLTPAEQMRRIRDAANSLEPETPQEAYAVLAAHFSRLDMLRGRIDDLESKMLLKEQPFVSHAPLIGPLIVRLRSIWNWMSTKWYVLPLMTQQNEFNMTVTQTLREVVASIESVGNAVQATQMRLAELEDADGGDKQEPGAS